MMPLQELYFGIWSWPRTELTEESHNVAASEFPQAWAVDASGAAELPTGTATSIAGVYTYVSG